MLLFQSWEIPVCIQSCTASSTRCYRSPHTPACTRSQTRSCTSPRRSPCTPQWTRCGSHPRTPPRTPRKFYHSTIQHGEVLVYHHLFVCCFTLGNDLFSPDDVALLGLSLENLLETFSEPWGRCLFSQEEGGEEKQNNLHHQLGSDTSGNWLWNFAINFLREFSVGFSY